MFDLKDDLESLHKLNEVRRRAKDLREQGLRSLREIKSTQKLKAKPGKDFFMQWTYSDNEAEVALLVKVQNHQNISEREENNDKAIAHRELTKRLMSISLEKLLPKPDTQDVDATLPVLVAARAMQAFTDRPETVFCRASMFCYYRIIRELYYAAAPDWTIGAARAGRGGRTSAFITSECIRAILGFESAIRRTREYFEHTGALYKRYLQLEAMLTGLGIEVGSDHPLSKWADKAIERMWLDWYISTNPRNGAIALSGKDDANEVLPFPPKLIEPPDLNMKSVGAAFPILKVSLAKALDMSYKEMSKVRKEIAQYRENKEVDDTKDRTESAYRIASKVIEATYLNAFRLHREYRRAKEDTDLQTLLDYLLEEYKAFPAKIHRVLEPAKRYVSTVLDRELAIAYSSKELKEFDAGELIFAATAFGAATNWQESEKLKLACDLLVKALPEGGRFTTNRPFHATVRGYKLLPIGCEMTRSFSKLLHRTHYEFEPQLAVKLLSIFSNNKQLVQSAHGNDKKRAGWNFENAPDAGRPCAWVTAISIQALDRIVRMLNDRINEIVFKHFKVIQPDNPHTSLTLNELIYPDYGLSEYYVKDSDTSAKKTSIAVRLEQMRAHVMRVSLPEKYKTDQHGNQEKVFSAILYGPPGTGKTSLLEALALSSNVPLVMLSPSDIIVQGQEQLEGRAKVVFEALSMLSQVVILLDEFEPILRRRSPKLNRGTGPAQDLSEVTKAIREGGVSMLKFLLTGMLPKLIGLHDAAEKQSMVYCLATNHLEEIDEAAKRDGRFDVRQPIFNPDPVSRAGTFLFRLQRLAEKLKKDIRKSDPNQLRILAGIISATANENAGELSRKFFKLPTLEKAHDGAVVFSHDSKRRSFFAPFLGEGIDLQDFEKRVEEMKSKNFEKLKREFDEAKIRLDGNDELLEREWLFGFEAHVKETGILNAPENFLKKFLTYIKPEAW
jgi:hypothetical protein